MLFYYISKNVGSVIMSHTPTFIVEPFFCYVGDCKKKTKKKGIEDTLGDKRFFMEISVIENKAAS